MAEDNPAALLPRDEPVSPRADLWTAAVFFVIGAAIVAASWAMPTYFAQQGEVYQAPGLVPALHGFVIALLGFLLGVRAVRTGRLQTPTGPRPPREGYSNFRLTLATGLCLAFAVVLVGRLPFVVAAAVFVTVFILLFEWRGGASWAQRLKQVAVALAIGAGTGIVVVLVFERLFLVRLP